MVKATRLFVIIGTPGDRRVTLFQEALAGLDLPPASVISYADLLENCVDLDAMIPRHAIVRIESPGKDWAVNRALALRGSIKKLYPHFPSLEQPGDYIPSWAWYNGFCTALQQPQILQKQRSDLVWMNSIPDIRLMFDKSGCNGYLDDHDLPTPSFESRRYRGEGGASMIKARYGSSGTGIVAVQSSGWENFEEYFHTTVALQAGKLINTRHIRQGRGRNAHSTDEAIHLWQRCEAVYSQPWIPKATIPGGAFDLRIVMIAGRMRHIVVRVSKSPITNLHLLNTRGDFEEVRRRLSDAAWHRIEETCEQVAALFPNSLYMGIDLLITPTWNKHYVLEVNAFGDLLPNLLHEGEDTYTAEIKAILKKS